MDNDEENSCVICCESLLTTPIGTTVPCGHLFHVDCFGEWGARNSNNRDLKCPICNGVCSKQTPFVRIFVNLEATAAAMKVDESDSDSCSSSSDVDNIDLIGPTQAIPNCFPYGGDYDGADEVEVLCVKAPENKRSTLETTSCIDVSSSRYKRKAKALKGRVKRLETVNGELSERAQSLNTELMDVKEKSDDMHANFHRLTEENKKYILELQENKVALLRHISLVEKWTKQAKEYERQASQAMNELVYVQEGHHQAIREAQSSSLAEVRELRREHTALSTDHQIVNQKLAKQNEFVQRLQRRVKDLEEKLGLVDTMPRALPRNSIRDLETYRQEVSRNASQFKAQRREEEERDVARDERKEMQRKMSGKGTALAARMCRASEKKIASTTINQILRDLDMVAPNKKRHMDHNIQITSAKATSSNLRRKDAFDVKSLVARKRSVQNDIRDMFKK